MGYAFIFPGQGSQQPGMGSEFIANHALARELFAEANEVLGFDLLTICQEGPAEELALTFNAQPAILTVSTIAQRLLAERVPLAPQAVAGHSLGEYSALVAVGVLSFAEAVRAVHLRGKFMQEATPLGRGAMAAILGQEAEAVEALCQEEAQGQVVGPANFNAPGQVVISGDAEAVQRVLARARGKLLTVSAPFHSPLMAPAAEAMKPVLEALSFQDAQAPVVANASGRFLTAAEEIRHSLVEQITAPVRWESGMGAMIEAGITQMIELGHGKVLSGLMKRIDKSMPVANVQTEASLDTVAAQLEAQAT